MHRSRPMASPPAPPSPTSPWLHLASRLGRVAIVCLVIENFLLLLAPLAFLLGLGPNTRLWSFASGLILAASLLYLFLALRIEAGAKPLQLSSLKWPLYGAVNVFGSLAIAGFFQGLAAGHPNFDAFTLGLVVKMTLVPVLGVLAYRDLLDRFPGWGRLPAAGAPVPVALVRPAFPRVHAPRRAFASQWFLSPVRPLPPPPSPENTMRPPPPPPAD